MSHGAAHVVVDLGTNSVVLLVAKRAGLGWQVLAETAEVTGLGRGIGVQRTLDPVACVETLVVLERFARLCEPFAPERVEVVGTSVLREMVDGSGFCEGVRELFGVAPRILSPVEEGELGFLGGVMGLNLEGTILLVDLGGGSTELVVGAVEAGTVRVIRVESVPLGCLRNQLFKGSPRADREALGAAMRVHIETLGVLPSIDHVVGVGGSITTLAALQARIPFDVVALHGTVLSCDALDELLVLLDSDRRLALAELVDPKRLPRLPSGAVLLKQVLEATGSSKLVVSTRGLRFGVLLRGCM